MRRQAKTAGRLPWTNGYIYIYIYTGRAEVEVRVSKLKNGKAAGKNDITGEMIKGVDDRVVDWIWRLCNMAFESGVVTEDWRSAVIIPLYKGKEEKTECKNYKGINLLSVVGEIYAGILVIRVCTVTGVCLMMSKGALEQGGGV